MKKTILLGLAALTVKDFRTDIIIDSSKHDEIFLRDGCCVTAYASCTGRKNKSDRKRDRANRWR